MLPTGPNTEKIIFCIQTRQQNSMGLESTPNRHCFVFGTDRDAETVVQKINKLGFKKKQKRSRNEM